MTDVDDNTIRNERVKNRNKLAAAVMMMVEELCSINTKNYPRA